MAQDTVYEMVNERILAALDKGTVPWRMPWRATDSAPRNIDGYRYRGINTILTLLSSMEHGFTSPYWLTFKQAKAKGGSVRKGEKSTVIVFWKRIRVTDKHDPDGERKVTVPMLRYYRVFNLEQTEGVTLPRKVLEERLAASVALTDHEPIETAETIAAGYPDGPDVVHSPGRAFYRPATDTVSIPGMEQYAAGDLGEYYSTLFHEYGHSTGHESRLDRDTRGYAFDQHTRGREELVAEFTAAYLCAEAGIETTLDNSAAYIDGWRSKIKEDPRAVVVAAGAGQRASDLILGRKAPHEQDDDESGTEAPVKPAATQTPDTAPEAVTAAREVTPRKTWTPAPWHAAALADYREARLVWESTRETYSRGYDTEADEFAELYPAPRLADFIRDHAARLRAERGDDTEQAA